MNLRELQKLAGIKLTEAYKGPGYVVDIEKETKANTDFRKVLFTSNNTQLVLMSIPQDDDIGMETHDDLDQFIRIDAGKGYVTMDGVKTQISNGFAMVIPAGVEHNIVNTGKEPLQLYAVYAPPNHQKDVVHHTKDEAESDDEHFDGETDV
jgi:mannose-6-phosphate isomerase-like protein (cupin superfamily)